MTLKDRIIALKRLRPNLKPAQIARELNCRRGYVSRVLTTVEEPQDRIAAVAAPVPPQALGSGRKSAGYVRLI